MLIKTIAGATIFALIGGAIGYSQVLCPDGQCSITGTPYGGALFGGILGLAVMSSVGQSGIASNTTGPTSDSDPATSGEESDADRSA